MSPKPRTVCYITLVLEGRRKGIIPMHVLCMCSDSTADSIRKRLSSLEWHARCRYKEKGIQKTFYCLWAGWEHVGVPKRQKGTPDKGSSQTDTVLKAWEKIDSPSPIQQVCNESLQLGQTKLSGVSHNHWHMGIHNTWMGTQQASPGKGPHLVWQPFTPG